MLDLVLNRVGTNNDGTLMYLEDATEWESEEQRSEYNLFLNCSLERLSGPVSIVDIKETLTYFSYDVLQNSIPVTNNGVQVTSTPLSWYEAIINGGMPVLHNGIPVTYDKYPVYSPAVSKTDYTIGTSNDGYYSMNMVAVSRTLPYEEGTYGTDCEGNIVLLLNGELLPKTISDLVTDENFNDWVNLKTLLLARLSIYTNDSYLEYFNESQKYFNDGGHYPEIFLAKRNLDFAKSALNSAQYVWELDNYTGAQSIIENMEVLWQ